jgi:acetyltransferase EpsM
MTKAELFVAGTRTFAAEVAGYVEEIGFSVAGLLEPFERSRAGRTIHGYPVSWLDETQPQGRAAVVGTGETDRRPIVDRLSQAGWSPATLVHPAAHVAATSTVGPGAVVGPGVVIGAYSEIGDYAVIGRGGLVGHHTHIGPFVTLGPGVNVAGNVNIGADVFVGMGAAVRDHVTIGRGAIVGMGALVLADIAAGIQVRGAPARPHGAAS